MASEQLKQLTDAEIESIVNAALAEHYSVHHPSEVNLKDKDVRADVLIADCYFQGAARAVNNLTCNGEIHTKDMSKLINNTRVFTVKKRNDNKDVIIVFGEGLEGCDALTLGYFKGASPACVTTTYGFGKWHST